MRLIAALGMLIATSVPVMGQTPAPGLLPADVVQPKQTSISDVEMVRFDPHAAEVRRTGSRWQLWSGKTMLKDFGPHRDRAFEARRLVADLNLTEHAVLGRPEPVVDVWLSGGKTPPLPAFGRQVVPFDPETVTVLDHNGTHVVRDERRVLLDFGSSAQEAHRAVNVIKQFQFNEIAYLGSPDPSMTYLLRNANARRTPGQIGVNLRPQLTPQGIQQHALEIPGIGRVGDRRAFDPIRLELHRAPDGWHLLAGALDLGAVSKSEYQARTAMQIMQSYPLTEYAQMGGGEFNFFLSNHMAPRGAPIGVRQARFDTKTLAVKKDGSKWLVGDGKKTLAELSSADDARRAIQAIKHFGFNTSCEIGTGLKYLATDR